MNKHSKTAPNDAPNGVNVTLAMMLRPVFHLVENFFAKLRALLGLPILLGEIEVTQGNINNHHIYVSKLKEKFPENLRGGEKANPPVLATLEAQGMQPVRTDITDEKGHQHFRARAWPERFFKHTDAKPGDFVRVYKLARYRYKLSLKKKPRY